MADHHYHYYYPRVFVFIIMMMVDTKVNGSESVMVTVLLHEKAASEGAVCLDGSPPAYHHAKGFGDGANNWMVYLWGGGWCSSASECQDRSTGIAGSSVNYTIQDFSGILINDQIINPDFYDWNIVSVRYCDGGSFLGDVEQVDSEEKIYYRGARIFKAVIEDLLAKGMNNAENAMLVGNSAGGIATIMNCDRFRDYLPNAKRVKCVSDSGFILWGKDRPGVEYRQSLISKVVSLHGITKNLPTSCTSKMDPYLCFFPENVVKDMKTPLFIQNSAFDEYQIRALFKPQEADSNNWVNCIHNLTLCEPNNIQTMQDFHTTFLETLQGLGECSSRGEFINSCYAHDFIYTNTTYNWKGSPSVDNKTIAEAIGDWYFDRSAVHLIDTVNTYPLNCTLIQQSLGKCSHA